MTKDDRIVELRLKFHDLSNMLGLIIMRGGLYSRTVPRNFDETSKLKEYYEKSLEEHGKSEKDALKASEAMTAIRKLVYEMLEVDSSKPVK